jgi:antitoxin component YwqK of YwqJK toxin-antitoxin module
MKYALFFMFLIFQLKIFGQINQTDSKGRKQGNWEKKYPNSNVTQYKGQFTDNKPVGVFTYFYPEGQVKAIIEHLKDGHRSKATFYFENKMMLSDGFYFDQKKDSTWVNYNPEGLILSVETYKNDKLNGKKVIYYLEGQIETEKLNPLSVANYKDDKLDGDFKEYFSTGKIKKTGNYSFGKQIGEWKEFYPNGKVYSISKFRNDFLHGWVISFDKEGVEISRFMYQNGERLDEKQLNSYLKMCQEKGIDPNQ